MITSKFAHKPVLMTVLMTVLAQSVHAAPKCLQTDNPCSPDKLCTFKADLAEKVLLYQLFLRNSQVTKSAGKREGVRYNGALYDASLADAAQTHPNDAVKQSELALIILQQKARETAEQTFRLPTCALGALDVTLLPKAGYAGMTTNDSCQARANFEGGDYDSDTFGDNDATSCVEFYDRDRAHEVVHVRTCEAEKKLGTHKSYGIAAGIEDEVAAYRHSVKVAAAYVRLLSFQCSARRTPAGLRTRARAIQALMAPYQAKGG